MTIDEVLVQNLVREQFPRFATRLMADDTLCGKMFTRWQARLEAACLAGFRRVGIVDTPDGQALLMTIEREPASRR